MTVTRIGTSAGEPMVWCVWFEGAKDVYALFPPDALKAPLDRPEALDGPSEPPEALTEATEPPEPLEAPEWQPNAAPEL